MSNNFTPLPSAKQAQICADLSGAYSRRINFQHRIVYEVFAKGKTVRVLRLWTHYD